jgi:hypothetical protein
MEARSLNEGHAIQESMKSKGHFLMLSAIPKVLSSKESNMTNDDKRFPETTDSRVTDGKYESPLDQGKKAQ